MLPSQRRLLAGFRRTLSGRTSCSPRAGEELVAAIKHKWLDELCGEDRMPMFFVGDQHRRPGQFLVPGTWSPIRQPDEAQLTFQIAA
jgi:hypothetical protein